MLFPDLTAARRLPRFRLGCLLACLSAVLAIPVTAQTTAPAKAPAPVSAEAPAPAAAGVLVSGAGLAKPVRVTDAQLAKLPRLQATRAGHDGTPRTYSGVDLYAVLLAAGADLAPAQLPGKGMAHYVQVGAADGYQAVFALAELSPDFAPSPVLLADRCDGQPLPAAAGPYQIIVPADKKMGRCVRQVQTLRIAAAPRP